jgi:hypothetical protein
VCSLHGNFCCEDTLHLLKDSLSGLTNEPSRPSLWGRQWVRTPNGVSPAARRATPSSASGSRESYAGTRGQSGRPPPATPSEAAPLTAKSVGTSSGPCGFLSASSRRDSRSGVADRRHPLRRIGRPKPKSPSLCHPSWLVRRSKRLCGSGREEHYALLRTWLKCQSLRVQGALVPDVDGCFK